MKHTITSVILLIILTLFSLTCKQTELTTGNVTGTVKAVSDETPLADVTVTLNYDVEDLTGADGSFNFSEIETGEYTVTAIKDGYKTMSQAIVLTDGETENLTFLMEDFIPALSIPTDSIQTPTPEAGSTSMELSSNTNWTTSSNVSWLTCSPQNGKGNAAITINWTAYTQPEHRIGKITISAEDVETKTLVVTQVGTNALLTISPRSQDVIFEAGSVTFNVEADVLWYVESNSAWLSLDKTEGENNGTIIASFTENPELVSRTATITLSGGGKITTATVIQAEHQQLAITVPNNSNAWDIGRQNQIRWEDNFSEDVKLELYKGDNFIYNITNSAPSTGVYTWAPPSMLSPGTDYSVKVTSTLNPNLTGRSSQFELQPYLESGLIAYYPFNGNATDESDNAFDANATNATLAADHNSYANCAYTFDGDNDYINCGNVMNTIISSNTYSINLWCYVVAYTNEIGKTGVLINKWDSPNATSNNGFSIHANGSFYSSSNTLAFTQPPQNVWKMITVVLNGGNLSIYVDGVLNSSESGHDCNASTLDLILGNNYDFTNDYNGKLDDVRIYNRMLLDSEISALYNLK